MQINKHLEIQISVFDIKKMCENFNRHIYRDSREYILKRMMDNFCSANPNDIKITLNEICQESTPFVHFDENWPAQEIKDFVKDFWSCIFMNTSEIEDAKSGRVIVYRDVEYTEGLFFIDFEELA